MGMGMGMHPSKSKSLVDNHNHRKRRTTKTVSDRLTPREETELLRRAVEYRRIHQLEKDLALKHHNFLPMPGVRAEAAGYGERLDDYEEAKHRGQLARETLVTSNMGLVRYCVNQIIGKETAAELTTKRGGFGGGRGGGRQSRGSGGGLPLNSLSREDLLQEGAIGLARAVDKWNPEIGGKFSTYAVYWIRAAVLRCIAERDELVRVPSHVSQAITKINKAAKRLGWALHESGGILVTTEGGGGSSGGSKSVLLPQMPMPIPGSSHSNPRWRAASAAKQLAEEAGLSEKHFEEAMTARRRRYTGGYVPVESWMHPGGSRSRSTGGATALPRHYSDENEDHDRRRMEEAVANEDLRSVLSKHLRPKEMEALSWRYGLYDEDEQEKLQLQLQQQRQQQRRRQQQQQKRQQQQQQRQNLAGQSIKERANRQLLELEDQLFGPSAVAAASKAPAAKSKAQRVRPVKASASTLTSRATAKPSMAKPGRFGEAMTFTEVGKKMQVSAEYTRRLCHKALGKLQQAAEDGTLEPALLF